MNRKPRFPSSIRIALTIALVCIQLLSFAATITSTVAGGIWGASGTWVGGVVPVAGDDVVIVSTATVNLTTNQPCNSLTINGVLNLNTNNRTLTVAGAVTMNGTASIQGNNNNRVINAASFTVAMGASATVQNVRLTISGAAQINGTLTFNTGNSAIKSFGSLTVSNTGTFTNTSNNVPITINGNMTNNGTFSQGTGLVTFGGATSNTVTGTAASTAFGGGITINKGTSQANVLDVQCVITMLAGGLTLTNGTFKLSSASTITAFTSDPAFGANSQLWCNGGTVLGSNTGVSFSGQIQVTAGTLNIGTSVDNYLLLNGGTVLISGGVMNVSGELTDFFGIFSGNFIMSNGTCNVNTVGSTFDYPFDISSGASQFSMTGGALVIQNAGTVVANAGYFNYAGTSTFSGGTLQIGNASTNASSTIGIDTTNPIGNLTVNSANATAQVQTQAIVVSNNVIISSGALTANGFDISAGGNWTNNGIFTPTNATVTLNGAAQTFSGNPGFFYNLTLGGSGTKTFGVVATIASNLAIGTGVVANLGTITTHTTRTLSLGGNGQLPGSYGSTSSAATIPNNTYFTSGTTGVLNVSNILYYSRQTGNWNSSSTWSTVTYANATNIGTFPVAGDVVNIGGGSFTITVNVNSACNSISYQSNVSFSPVVTVSSGSTLNVSGAITIPRASNVNPDINTFDVGAGTLNVGSIAFTNSGGANRHQVTISTGTATVSGDVTADIGSFGSPTITFTGAGVLNLAGAFLNSFNGTLNVAANCTVNYNGAAQTVGDFTYSNLTLSGSGTKDLSTAIFNFISASNNFVMSGTASATAAYVLTVGGSVTLGAGTSFTAGAFTHTVGGNWTNNGATFNNAGSTISLVGGAQTIGGSSSTTFNNLILAGTGSSTKTFGVATIVAANLSQANTIVINPGSIITHTAQTYTYNGAGQVAGSWGSISSAATNKTNTNFTAGTTGILNVSGRQYYSIANANWAINSTWSTVGFGGAAATSFPGSNDIVNIGRGFTVTVAANATCNSLIFESGNTFNSTVSINSGFTLAVSGAIIIPRGSTGGPGYTNTLAVGNGSLTGGSLDFPNGWSFQLHVLSINNGTATITGDITKSAPVGFGTSATITFTGTGLLNVAGAFLNSTNATLNQGTGTVNYNGAVAQTIGDFTYYNLTLNNTFATAPQFTLFGNTTVTNILTMTSGVVNLAGSTLTSSLGASGALAHSLASTSGWLYGGTFTRSFPTTAITVGTTTDGLMPMGTSANFRPFFFGKTNTGGSAGTISMTHTDPSTTTTGLSIPDTSPVATIIIRNNAVWNSTLTGGTGATFGIRYGGTGLGTVASLNDVRSMLVGSVIGTNVTATTVSTSDPRVERSGLTAAQLSNGFYVGSTNSATSLPIELVSFTGTAQKYGVDLKWSTASELNNDYFTVLRSSTGTNFESIGTVKGNGTTNSAHSYSLTDFKPLIGKNYYRLKQTDFDGNTTTTETIVVNVLSLDPMASLYPNPVSQNQLLNLEIYALQPNVPAELQIINMQGVSLSSATVQTDADGTLKTTLSPANLTPGLYILKVQATHFKFIVE